MTEQGNQQTDGAPLGRILYGGTFDPPHQRHVEVALAALRLLARQVDGVDFIPSAQPPHKTGRKILPFDLRCRLVEAALAETRSQGAPLNCNRLEGERQGPSYTWDTLAAFSAAKPGCRPYFLLGGEDYALLPHWRNGLELPRLCNLLVAPRGEVADASAFCAVTFKNWPTAREGAPLAASDASKTPMPRMLLPGGGEALLLPLPPKMESSSEIRKLWLKNKTAPGLSEKVLQLLEQNQEAVEAAWKEEL